MLHSISWDYFTALSCKCDVNAKKHRWVMDSPAKELVESKRNFIMFCVAEWHKSVTTIYTHLFLKAEVADLVYYYWKSNNYSDNRGV